MILGALSLLTMAPQRKAPSKWRLSCCTNLGSQRLFQRGPSPRLALALCCPCRVPRVLPWRMSQGWQQRWSQPLLNVRTAWPAPACAPARQRSAGLGSAGLPWHVPRPALHPCGRCAAVTWAEWPDWAALLHAQPGCHTAGAAHCRPSRAAALRRLPVPWLYHDSFLASPAGLSAFP